MRVSVQGMTGSRFPIEPDSIHSGKPAGMTTAFPVWEASYYRRVVLVIGCNPGRARNCIRRKPVYDTKSQSHVSQIGGRANPPGESIDKDSVGRLALPFHDDFKSGLILLGAGPLVAHPLGG